MCGFITIHSNVEPVSREALTKATRSMHHRGPDGQGQWVAPHRRVGMGHARLSIIDLTSGDQPIANEDEQIHIVVNGEFYDHERIQNELVTRGHRLRTKSDSEILAHLYEDFGTHCMKDLRGEFAFALWDERNGLLFAARDRFGIKPLYYAQVGDKLYLASEIKALLAAGVPAEWDHESVYQDLTMIFDNDRTLFRGIHQVPPGHFLLATRYRVELQRYWDYDYPREDDSPPELSEKEYIEQFRDGLLEATRLRLRADVPVGCYLSGGIDSCALLGMAATLHPKPIEAFTIKFEEGPYDEGPIAEEMAKKAGANYHPFRMPETMLADHFGDAVWQCETMTFNSNCVAKYLLSEKVRDFGFKVVLTGEGSDENLAGYAPFRRDMFLHGYDEGEAAKQKRLDDLFQKNKDVGRFMLPMGDTLPLDGIRRTLGFVPTMVEATASRGKFLQPLLSPDFAAEFRGRDPYQMMLNRLDVAGQMTGRHPVHQSMYLFTKTIFANKLLNFLGDRMEMAHSIEGRTPFLDHHLVALASRMPISMKIRDSTEKYVLREAARPYLTDTVYRRQKHPFLAPSQMKGKLFELVQDTLRNGVLASIPFFDRKRVLDLLDGVHTESDAGARDRSFASLLLITSACVLHERYQLGGTRP